MKLPVSVITRRPLASGLAAAAVGAMLMATYGAYRWDRARGHLIRIEGVALQAQQQQQVQAARIAELERTMQQLVAQMSASSDSTQKTFAQIVATTTQLTAAVNANGDSAAARINQRNGMGKIAGTSRQQQRR